MSASFEETTVTLPAEMLAQVRDLVEAGEYASSSAVIEEALCDWAAIRSGRQTGLEDMRRAWLEARADAKPGISSATVLDRLERKYRTLAQQRNVE